MSVTPGDTGSHVPGAAEGLLFYFSKFKGHPIVTLFPTPTLPPPHPPHRPRSRLMSPQPLWFMCPEMFSLIPQINLTRAPPSALTSSSSQDDSTFINLQPGGGRGRSQPGEPRVGWGHRRPRPAGTPLSSASGQQHPCSLPGCRFFIRGGFERVEDFGINVDISPHIAPSSASLLLLLLSSLLFVPGREREPDPSPWRCR